MHLLPGDSLTPSILNQSDRDFHWFVGVDSSVSKCFKARLRDVIGESGSVVEVPEGSSFKALVTERLEPLGSHCIRARLDSDDAVSWRFIGALQNNSKKLGHVSNFPVGLGFFKQEELSFVNGSGQTRSSPLSRTRVAMC